MSTSIPRKHKAIALVADETLDVVEASTRSPEAGEVLIEVELASYGAVDGHAVDDGFYVSSYPQILGLVAVGKVVQVGDSVTHVKKGDTVGACTMPGADRATQEFIIAPANRVCNIPEGASSAEVAAILDNFVTAWWTLSDSLKLPLPTNLTNGVAEPTTDTATASMPIVIWGGGTASAQYMIQLLRYFGFTNIIATASARSSARALILGATHVVDYNDPNVAERIATVAGTPVKLAVDTVCTEGSLKELSKIVREPGSRVALLMPIKVGTGTDGRISEGGASNLLTDLPREHNPFHVGVDAIPTFTFTWETNETLRANLLTSIFPQLVRAGKITSQPVRLLNSGSQLERVKEAAMLMRTNKLGGEKAIIVMKDEN